MCEDIDWIRLDQDTQWRALELSLLFFFTDF
jgi:hypothetical protein